MLDNKDKYFQYEISKNGETLQDISNHFYEGKVDAQTLLQYSDNYKRILGLYTDEERKNYVTANSDFLKVGTILFLPLENRSLILNYKEPESYLPTEIQNISEAWWTERVKSFLDKTLYSLKQKNTEEYLIKRRNNYYVKIWSRILNEVIYVTPYITDFSISVSDDGGNFNFDLSAINGAYKDGKWQMLNIQNFGDEQSFSKTNLIFDSEIKIFETNSFAYNPATDTYQTDAKNKTFSDLYFEKILNPQDLVFIKLDESFKNPNSLDFDDFDMIGTLDSIKPLISINENLVDCIIKVSGRDLMKLFIEDGTYFFPIEYFVTNDGTQIISTEKNSMVKRIFGKLYDPLIFNGGQLSKWLDFILNNLTVTDFDIPTSSGKGIWDWIEFQYEDVAGKRFIIKPSIATMSGSIINYLKELADYPFVEIIGDTFGSKYTIIFRTPPYSKEAYKNNRTIEISIRYLTSNNTGIDDKNMKSWFWMKPEGNFFGVNDAVNMSLFPPVYFSKLAKIFGSKKLDKTHKYSFFNNNNEKSFIDSKRQSVYDFKWLIESFASEPFMKKGTLTFKNIAGIKKGINIYIPEIDMLFYVKSYNHNITINDRVTTVEVDRGIHLKNIDLYYNLVNIRIDEQKNSLISATLNEEVLNKLLEKNYD